MKTLFAFLMFFSLSSARAYFDPKEAYAMVQAGEAVLIDIREAHEVKAGIVPNALWFPLSKVSTERNWLEEFKEMTKDKKIFLYCRSGNRVEKLRKILLEYGIEAVNLGGYADLMDILFR